MASKNTINEAAPKGDTIKQSGKFVWGLDSSGTDSSLISKSRRRMLKTVGGASAAALLSGCLGGGSGSETTINILTWEEYADITDSIGDDLGININVTSSTSGADMFSSWNAGEYEQYDIAVPDNNYVQRFADAELIDPVDKNIVNYYNDIYDNFKNLSQSQFSAGSDNVWGVPMRFGWNGYSYDSRAVPDHEASWSVLFENKFDDVNLDGEIVMYDGHYKAMSATALYLGYQDAFEGEEVTLSSEQIEEIKQTLISQKQRLQGYIAEDPTYIQNFSQGNFLIGQSGRNEIVEMWSNGIDWPVMTAPKEGALAWFEVAVVSKASDSKESAWEIVNQLISPEYGAKLAQAGFSPSVNPDTQMELSDQENYLYGSVDPELVESFIPFKAVSNEDRWLEAWEEIKAA
jgi:spermidine/putrescine transport system substrate-binding protein